MSTEDFTRNENLLGGDWSQTYSGSGASVWRIPEPVPKERQWMNIYVEPGTSAWIRLVCGCELEITPDSAPVRAWECAHGNYIRAT